MSFVYDDERYKLDDEWEQAVKDYNYTAYEESLIGMGVVATVSGGDYTYGHLQHITDLKTGFGVLIFGDGIERILKRYNAVVLLNDTLYEKCHLGTGLDMSYGDYKKMISEYGEECDEYYPC